ncbi:hypothetical protein IU514_13510 [Lysobacter niastensis]|uniref:Uncharacterized protein n=1 Tax=Lysobacter niastensis TaxID=380629 RepID=A0ABS0B805_9GAMM|nr:hypothetical protein [Lysobacter niastensis]
MKLIAEKLGKSDKLDRLRFVRADGSETRCPMPRQGTLPHDLVHYVVESALPLKHGFLGLVAAGSEASFIMQAVHDPANPALETEAVQAEAIVEALQTQLWGGTFDRASFLEAVQLATISRDKPVFEFVGLDPEALYSRALCLMEQWSQVPFHQSMELAFVAGDG